MRLRLFVFRVWQIKERTAQSSFTFFKKYIEDRETRRHEHLVKIYWKLMKKKKEKEERYNA